MERTLSDRLPDARTSRTSNDLLSIYDSGLPGSEKPKTQFSNYLLFLLGISALIFVIAVLLVFANNSKFTTTTGNVLIYVTLIIAAFALISISLCADKQRGNVILGLAIALMVSILLWFIITTTSFSSVALAFGILLLFLGLIFIYMVQGSVNILLTLPLVILPIAAIFTNWYIR